jgi:hypothetical protein
VLRELRRIQKEEHKNRSEVVSELLLLALEARRKRERASRRPFNWLPRDLRARFDMEALHALWTVVRGEDADRRR